MSAQLKPLAETALNDELRLVLAGISRMEQHLRRFEKRFGLSTSDFVRRFENDAMGESLEYAEWLGEHRLLEHQKEKAEACEVSALQIE